MALKGVSSTKTGMMQSWSIGKLSYFCWHSVVTSYKPLKSVLFFEALCTIVCDVQLKVLCKTWRWPVITSAAIPCCVIHPALGSAVGQSAAWRWTWRPSSWTWKVLGITTGRCSASAPRERSCSWCSWRQKQCRIFRRACRLPTARPTIRGSRGFLAAPLTTKRPS